MDDWEKKGKLRRACLKERLATQGGGLLFLRFFRGSLLPLIIASGAQKRREMP